MGIITADKDSAHVPFPPPLALLAFVLLGAGIHYLYPIHLIPENLRWVLGPVFFLSGFLTVVYCKFLFTRANTEIKPWKTTSAIVSTGVYKYTRNPIYLSFLIAGLGVAFAVNTVWIAILMIPCAYCLYKLAIEREERYLEKKFGDEYRSYKSKVRRWI